MQESAAQKESLSPEEIAARVAKRSEEKRIRQQQEKDKKRSIVETLRREGWRTVYLGDLHAFSQPFLSIAYRPSPIKDGYQAAFAIRSEEDAHSRPDARRQLLTRIESGEILTFPLLVSPRELQIFSNQIMIPKPRESEILDSCYREILKRVSESSRGRQLSLPLPLRTAPYLQDLLYYIREGY